ncbi:MAG: porin family protein [Bacteroidaceae bacterium]|nr:porin family protein [Bacteroidaceae bacterium]
MRMWLLLLSHFLIFSFSPSLSAQPADSVPVAKKTKPWHLGFEGGLDISRFSASRELFSPDSHTGWFVGAKVKVNIPMPNLSLDGAFLFNQSRLEYQEQDVYRHKNLHLFVVPVNLRYTWTIVPAFGLMFFTGPQWNWLLDKKRIGTVGELEHSFFDWNVGMGFEVARHVQLAFNYNIPLGKMGEVNTVNLEGHTWNIRFAYLF